MSEFIDDGEFIAPNAKYSTNLTEGDKLLDPISGNISEGDHDARSSAYQAAYNIICTVVGTGLLQLPYALQQSGWVGIGMLLIMAVMATYTAMILIKCLNPPDGQKLTTYGEIGQHVFGTPGRIVVELMLHLTLMGVATIYLILAGGNLSQLLQSVPQDGGSCSLVDIKVVFTSMIIAAVVWWHVWMRTLNEVSILSAFNVMVAVYLLVVVLVEIGFNFNVSGEPIKYNGIKWQLSLGGAFSSFAFSYGAHAVLPTVYQTMKQKSQFNVMIMTTFGIILCFYMPLTIIGYWAYGTNTQTPIYNSFCNEQYPCNLTLGILKYSAIIAITVHVMFSYAIVINPTEIAVEKLLKIDDRPMTKIWSIGIRTGLVLLTLIIGISVPFFGDFLDLVSALTNSFTSFVFPCVFYLVMFWPEVKKKYHILAWNGLIIVSALLGFGFGTYDAISELIGDITASKGSPPELTPC